ncbi:hypothetical protein F4778DRAFT_749131 [Xylariomycetidae sp. FL2044]|nr:hypothetical protein F4778DRAFT_749131 [Xylariomycetidae sp. FL2044]
MLGRIVLSTFLPARRTTDSSPASQTGPTEGRREQAPMARDHIDLTTTVSDSDDGEPVTRTPKKRPQSHSHSHSQSHSQSQSQPGSRTRRLASPAPLSRNGTSPTQGDAGSIHAATPPRIGKGSAQKPLPYDTRGVSTTMPLRSVGASKNGASDMSPPSTDHPSLVQRTPKHQTPRKGEWTTEKVEATLAKFAQEIGTDSARLTSRLIHQSWKNDAPKQQFISNKDWFADIKRTPVDAVPKSSDTMRIKLKQMGQGRSGKQEKREHHHVVCIETNRSPVPQYSFHHVEIRKNILSPNTMLTYVPHLRDLADNEESVYRRWLENLEAMDKTSGFATLSRHQKVMKTIQKERAITLLQYLDNWLERLNIENCTKATLIRYMANQSDTVTPQQKSSILNSYSEDSGSPRSAKAVKMFTEAFDRVFNDRQELQEHAVPLRDVLLLDKSVDTIVDAKKWMKDTPSQAKIAEEEMPVESFLETYALLGCIICTSNSCEHGEYGVDNERKRFSVEVVGGLSPMIRQSVAQRLKSKGVKSYEPCGDDCALLKRPGTRAKPWSENENMILKTFFLNFADSNINVACATAVATGRPCWDAQRQMDRLPLTLPSPESPSPRPHVKPLHWYDRRKKMLIGDWQEHTDTHEHQRKDHFDPCNHDGPCDRNCPCVQNRVLCERFCRCTAETCANKFTGCACHSAGKTCLAKQKDRPCICVQLNRECDPALCGSCGALERAMPENADNETLHLTGCQNCSLQKGKSKSVVLGKSRIAGYGLFATEDIFQDEFVIEYVGELISQDEGVRREARRGDVFDETSNSSYLFTLLEQEGIWVDAAIYGNLSRYINHQESNCNVTPRIMYVNGEYRIKFTSLRDIKAGEELFFHYGENFPNLTKKLLQEEKAIKKRRKAKEEKALQDGEKIRKKPGRKPGRRPGRKPGPKPKKKTFAAIESEPEEEIAEEPFEDPFVIVDPSRPRKRKRGVLGEDDTDETEYRPDISQEDGLAGPAETSNTGRLRFRKRLGPGRARKSEPASTARFERPPTKTIGNGQDENGAEVTPKRRGRKARKLDKPGGQSGITEKQSVTTPKRRGRKPRKFVIHETPPKENENEVVLGSRRSSARASVKDSGSRFNHTEARLELDSQSVASDNTPTRSRTRRQQHHADAANRDPAADSSPLSSPDSNLGFRDAELEISDSYDEGSSRAKVRTNKSKKSASGDDEYNGNSWSDSDGIRHHGGGDEESDDSIIPRDRRVRRRPARYDD